MDANPCTFDDERNMANEKNLQSAPEMKVLEIYGSLLKMHSSVANARSKRRRRQRVGKHSNISKRESCMKQDLCTWSGCAKSCFRAIICSIQRFCRPSRPRCPGGWKVGGAGRAWSRQSRSLTMAICVPIISTDTYSSMST